MCGSSSSFFPSGSSMFDKVISTGMAASSIAMGAAALTQSAPKMPEYTPAPDPTEDIEAETAAAKAKQRALASKSKRSTVKTGAQGVTDPVKNSGLKMLFGGDA